MRARNSVLNAEADSLDHFGNCPECGVSWDGGDIFTILRGQDWCREKSDEKLWELIMQSYAPPYKFSRLIGVEYPADHPQHYDGVSEWQCPDCKHSWRRFDN